MPKKDNKINRFHREGFIWQSDSYLYLNSSFSCLFVLWHISICSWYYSETFKLVWCQLYIASHTTNMKPIEVEKNPVHLLLMGEQIFLHRLMKWIAPNIHYKMVHHLSFSSLKNRIRKIEGGEGAIGSMNTDSASRILSIGCIKTICERKHSC